MTQRAEARHREKMARAQVGECRDATGWGQGEMGQRRVDRPQGSLCAGTAVPLPTQPAVNAQDDWPHLSLLLGTGVTKGQGAGLWPSPDGAASENWLVETLLP